MTIQLGDTAPDFIQDSTWGPLRLYDHLGDGWGVLFAHPADYTPVCTTELGSVARLHDEFLKRNTRVIGLSVDTVKDHLTWIEDIMETQGAPINFPLIADENRHVASLYGMIHPKALMSMSVRAVFVIGPDKRIKLTLNYPPTTGRNFHEILRVLDSLQLTERYDVSTPADWSYGEDCVIIPSIIDPAEIAGKFPKGFRAPKPYLRYTPQPNL